MQDAAAGSRYFPALRNNVFPLSPRPLGSLLNLDLFSVPCDGSSKLSDVVVVNEGLWNEDGPKFVEGR